MMEEDRDHLDQPTAGLERAEQTVQFASFRRLIDQGIVALEARDTLVAIQCFQTARDLARRYRLGDDAEYGALLNLGIAQRFAGDYKGALNSFCSALALANLTYQQRAAVWNHIGILHGEHGRQLFAASGPTGWRWLQRLTPT